MAKDLLEKTTWLLLHTELASDAKDLFKISLRMRENHQPITLSWQKDFHSLVEQKCQGINMRTLMILWCQTSKSMNYQENFSTMVSSAKSQRQKNMVIWTFL